MNADLFVPDLQPTAVDFGKLPDSAAHFDQIAEDCGRTAWPRRASQSGRLAANTAQLAAEAISAFMIIAPKSG